MLTNPENTVAISEANKNFSLVARPCASEISNQTGDLNIHILAG